MEKKVLLMILDGWGIGKHDKSDVIYTEGAPFFEKLMREYPHSELMACGEYVGLPDGQMGNSEVGHLNIGAGRIVYQDLVKINMACKQHKLLENKEIKAAYDYVLKSGRKLHFMGLCSSGGVHSSLSHLYGFLDAAKECGISNVFVHCFMDGRDTDPMSGKGFVEELESHMAGSCGKIASVIGRFYAMDRDKRWERVSKAYDLLVKGQGLPFSSAADGIQASYDAGVTDEFIKPIVITGQDGSPLARVEDGDAVIFFNFRNDRAREITDVLTQEDKAEYGMKKLDLYYCCLTPYDDKFKGLHILFDKENVTDTLGETVAKAGKRQLRIAETEKYAHVTFFFSGGREKEFDGESRILIPSPKVETYDLKPEMSAPEVTEALVGELEKGLYDMIVLNFANGDMVGHTGKYEAIRKAVKAVDSCVEKTVNAAVANGYVVLVTADHGNADNALNPDGTPNTAHSLNPVPFIVVDKDIKAVKNGKLADIAPTVLKLMGIKQPEEMTGEPLV